MNLESQDPGFEVDGISYGFQYKIVLEIYSEMLKDQAWESLFQN